jgi:hypothetical protein
MANEEGAMFWTHRRGLVLQRVSFRPESSEVRVDHGNSGRRSELRVAMFNSNILIAVALALVFCLLPSNLFGQATELGVISGTITDSQGAAVSGAKITATNITTNVRQVATSNSSGQYRIPNLLPAEYTVTVEAPGFKTVQINPFKLDVGETLTQNSILTVGAVSDHVEVTAQGELLRTTTVENSTTIESREIDNLPLNGRSYTGLIDLTPGADGTRLNGQWKDGNRFALDGANNTTIIGSSTAYVPNLDLIQEFSIDSHSSKAEEGGFLGATVNVATKSGTNNLRGDAWWFGRSNQFVARNPITNPSGTSLPPYHLNQYGFVVGGPVDIPKVYDGHNKTFFFFGFQRSTTSQQSIVYSRVPTTNELNGIFTDSLFFATSPGIQHLYDPATTTGGANPTRSPFPNDVIPSNRVDTLVQSYLKLILPAPNFTPDANHPTDNRLDVFPAPTYTNDYSIRIDQRFGERDQLFGRYSQVGNASTSYVTAPISQVLALNRKNLVVDWVHLFTPRFFIESNFAFQRFPLTIDNGFPKNAVGSLTQIGFNSAQIAAYGLPDLFGTDVATPYLIGHYVQGQRSPFSFNESASWNVGKHNAKFGVNLSRKYFQNIALGHHYTFSSIQTEDPNQSDPNASQTGLGLASALLGLPANVSLYQGNYTETYLNWAFYAEDEWKIRKNLTVDVGLRYDSYPTPNFTQGIINDWDFNNGIWYIGGGKLPPSCTASPVAPCIPGGSLSALPNGNMIQVASSSGIRHAIHDNFGPRVGIAWNVFRNTVVRGGFGIYFDPESNTAQEDQNTFGTWPSSTNLNLSYNAIGAPLTTVNQIDGQSLSPQTTGVPWGTQGYFWDPNKKNPMSYQWNIDIQQQLTKNFAVTTAYVGSLNRRSDMTMDVNAATTPGPGSASVVNTRRKWPFYGTDTLFGTDLGRGNYNALQVKAERRFSGGIQFLGSYTFAKTMDNGSNAWYSGRPQNSYNVNGNYGVSDADRTHILSLETVYELPFGRNRKWLQHGVLAAIAGGWDFNAIGTATSGNPIVLSVGGDPANIGNTQYNYDRPNLVGNPNVTHPSSKQWFNQSAFQAPVYAFGNAPRGLFRQPGFQNADMSILKNVAIRENVHLQLRFEAFNAFNLILRGPVDGFMTNNLNFGTIHSIGSTPRQLQFGGKLYF